MERYNIEGIVVHGQQLGRKIGFPTANILPGEDSTLPCGVYAAEAELANGDRYVSMVNIGYRPTVADKKNITIEAHLIGFDGDLYGQVLRLSLIQRVRDEKKMSGIDELKHQLCIDLDTVKQFFHSR